MNHFGTFAIAMIVGTFFGGTVIYLSDRAPMFHDTLPKITDHASTKPTCTSKVSIGMSKDQVLSNCGAPIRILTTVSEGGETNTVSEFLVYNENIAADSLTIINGKVAILNYLVKNIP